MNKKNRELCEDLAEVEIIKKGYVSINDNEIVTDRDDLEEEIFEILKENLEAEIKVYPTTKNKFVLVGGLEFNV